MSLEDDIKTEAYFYIDARGTIIKISSALAMQSPVLEAWITNWKKSPKEAFYVDYKPKDVHKLLDSLQKSNLRDYLIYNTPSLKFYDEFNMETLENLDIDVKLETVEKEGVKYALYSNNKYFMLKIKDKIFKARFSNSMSTLIELLCCKTCYSKDTSFTVDVCDNICIIDNTKYISLKYIKQEIFRLILTYNLMKEIFGVNIENF
jgi:hypothetical protein